MIQNTKHEDRKRKEKNKKKKKKEEVVRFVPVRFLIIVGLLPRGVSRGGEHPRHPRHPRHLPARNMIESSSRGSYFVEYFHMVIISVI